MKKTTAFFLSIIFAANVFAGKEEQIKIPYDSTTQKYAYNKVVEVAGKSAADLYATAKNWNKQKFSDDKFLIDENGCLCFQLFL